MLSVTVDGVTTGDAVPAVAPNRISNKATKNTATITFTPNDDGLLPLDDVGAVEGLLPEDPGPFPSESLFPSEALYPESFGLLPDDGTSPVIAIRFMVGGTTPYNGTEVSHKGRLATNKLACSENLTCENFEVAPNVQLTEDITYPETGGPADGPLTVSIWMNVAGEWA